jgi:hypothetical protein
MSDTPQEVVSVPVSVLEKAIEALDSAYVFADGYGGELARATRVEVWAALSALREVVRS